MRLAEIDDGFELRQVPLHEVVPDLFHRHALGLDELGDRDGRFRLIEAGPRASAQLFGTKGGHIDVEKSALDGRRFLVDDRAFFARLGGRLRGGIYLLDFSV